MRSPSSRPGRRRSVSAALGLAMAALGLLGLGAIIVAAYGGSAESWAWSYRLGLPGSLLASAVAQALVLVGSWLCWRALARRG